MKTELHNIPFLANVYLIDANICNLPEVNGYYCLVVCVDYSTRLSEVKPPKNKKVETALQFLCKF